MKIGEIAIQVIAIREIAIQVIGKSNLDSSAMHCLYVEGYVLSSPTIIGIKHRTIIPDCCKYIYCNISTF